MKECPPFNEYNITKKMILSNKKFKNTDIFHIIRLIVYDDKSLVFAPALLCRYVTGNKPHGYKYLKYIYSLETHIFCPQMKFLTTFSFLLL